jgi:hypothetical protein
MKTFTFKDNKSITKMIEHNILQKKTAAKTALIQATNLSQNAVDKILQKGGFQSVIFTSSGDAEIETINSHINAGDWIVTQLIGGKENSYIVDADDFKELYSKTETPNMYKPRGEERKVYIIPEDMNIELEASWGKMKIRGGGVILSNGKGGYYGINPEEFRATYSIIK